MQAHAAAGIRLVADQYLGVRVRRTGHRGGGPDGRRGDSGSGREPCRGHSDHQRGETGQSHGCPPWGLPQRQLPALLRRLGDCPAIASRTVGHLRSRGQDGGVLSIMVTHYCKTMG
jgi:hypothetical protein